MTAQRFEMALTLAEFERQLQPVLDGWIVSFLADGWLLRRESCTIRIRCQPLPIRHLGRLVLPRLDVDLCFSDCEKVRQAQFLECFQRYFRRGGG